MRARATGGAVRIGRKGKGKVGNEASASSGLLVARIEALARPTVGEWVESLAQTVIFSDARHARDEMCWSVCVCVTAMLYYCYCRLLLVSLPLPLPVELLTDGLQ